MKIATIGPMLAALLASHALAAPLVMGDAPGTHPRALPAAQTAPAAAPPSALEMRLRRPLMQHWGQTPCAYAVTDTADNTEHCLIKPFDEAAIQAALAAERQAAPGECILAFRSANGSTVCAETKENHP